MTRILAIAKFIFNVLKAIIEGLEVTAKNWPGDNPFDHGNSRNTDKGIQKERVERVQQMADQPE
jgi:hypothetical protein